MIYGGADPGFPVGDGGGSGTGHCRRPIQVLFSEIMCQNERIGSCWGTEGAGAARGARRIRQ